jgi:hypothetical protein
MAGRVATGDGLLEFRRNHLTDHKVHAWSAPATLTP